MSETAAERFARDHSSQEAERKTNELDSEPDEREARVYVDPTGASATGDAYDSTKDADLDGNLDKATGATAGTPGTWTPSGYRKRQNLADMAGCTASPGTAWTTGQYVRCFDNSQVSWNGSAWAAGARP